MQINSIPEEAHNTAMLTLIAERQELLYYRQKVKELEALNLQLLNELAQVREDTGQEA